MSWEKKEPCNKRQMAGITKIFSIFAEVSHFWLQICESVFALLDSKSGKFRESNGITLCPVLIMVVSTLCGTSYSPSVEYLPFSISQGLSRTSNRWMRMGSTLLFIFVLWQEHHE